MDIHDVFVNVILQYCDNEAETISRLARVSRMHYSVIGKTPIYREFADHWKSVIGNNIYIYKVGYPGL
jgi:hypothetical protein